MNKENKNYVVPMVDIISIFTEGTILSASSTGVTIESIGDDEVDLIIM